MIDDRFEPPARFADAADRLHELAATVTGSTDFGDDGYRWGLRVLLQSMDYDTRFTEAGRRIAWGQLVSALSSRAQAMRAMALIPDLDAHRIARPVVITGIPRSGTTALHKLLAVDPRFQGLQSWLIDAPMPRPPRESWESHRLYRQAVDRIARRFAATPDLRAAHDIVAEEVDECIGILSHSFVSNLWTCGFSNPSYDAWWQRQSERPAYRYLRRAIQMIGSTEPSRRWLLKNPGHICNLDLLFEVFPDAMVIQTHRDPAKAIPSLCALLMKHLRIVETQPHDLQSRLLAIRETEKWAKGIRDAEPVRASRAGQLLDVVHDDFHRDPIAVVRRIYDFIGMDLAPATLAEMTRRIDAAPERRHGEHRYDLADFGLRADEVRERFGSYVDRFDLVRPAAARLHEVRA